MQMRTSHSSSSPSFMRNASPLSTQRHRRPRVKNYFWVAGAALLLFTSSMSACFDRQLTEPLAATEKPYFDKGGIPHRYDCEVTVASQSVVCVAASSPRNTNVSSTQKSPGGPSFTLLGAGRVKLRSTNVVSDTMAQTLSADVTVQDSLSSPIGTPDGSTVVGSKVIFHSGPTATSYKNVGDTGTVTMANADGVGNYTGLNQPYYTYPGILAPYAISAPRHWIFNVPRAVKTFSFSTYVFTASPAYQWVPELAPSVTSQAAWDSLTAPGNILVNPPSYTGSIVSNALYVRFQPSAPANARENALAAVAGVVVGGVRLIGSDGYYIVKITTAPSPGDSANGPLFRARAALDGNASVRSTLLLGMDNLVTPTYLRPNDGVGYQKDDWRISRDSANGRNWALEAISAPLGWGCTNPSSVRPRAAIVDQDLFSVSDLAPNIAAGSELSSTAVVAGHGTSVASIIGAVGNNSDRMTGVMWNADIGLFRKDSLPPAGVAPAFAPFEAMMRAGRAGYPVINVSVALYWQKQFNRAPVNSSAADSTTAKNIGIAFADVIDQLETAVDSSGPRRPLFVVSSSNDGISAFWSGYAYAKLHKPQYASRIIVVGATELIGVGQMGLAPYSGRDSLVDIVAPGSAVEGLDNTGTVKSITGTSFAAPYVSGVAAALIGFDPRLAGFPDSLKTLIVNGAKRRGTVADPSRPNRPLPVLDMYESLRAVSERAGAPLCGNRVWKVGDIIVAQRDSSATENLVTLSPQSWQSSFLSVYHGGKRFDMDWSREFDWSAVTRTFSERTPYVNIGYNANGGAFLSYDRTNHDNTAYVGGSITGDSTGYQAIASLYNSGSQTLRSSVTFPRTALTAPSSWVCEVRDPSNQQCLQTGRDGNWTDIEQGSSTKVSADASDSTRGYLVVNIMSHAVTHAAWQTCNLPSGNYAGMECRPSTHVTTSDSTTVYRLNFATQTFSPVTMAPGVSSIPNRTIEWLAMNETGEEFIWGIGLTTTTNGTEVCTSQATQFVGTGRKVGVPAGTVNRSVSVVNNGVCSGEYEAGGTVSPYRGGKPGAGSAVLAPSHRSTP